MTRPERPPAQLLVPLTPQDSHPVALVCIPHAGAGVAAFHSWRELGQYAAVWAARFPGRESRLAEPLITSIDEMAQALVPAISAITARSVVLFGHCSGALIAYELASRLAQSRREAASLRLVLSSQRAPLWITAPTGKSVTQLSRAELADALRALGGTPDRVLDNAKLLALMEPAIRADLLAVERYRPAERAPLPFDIVVLGASDDQAVPAGSLQAWRDCTTGSFQIKWFEGQHFFVSKDGAAVVEYLADMLRSIA